MRFSKLQYFSIVIIAVLIYLPLHTKAQTTLSNAASSTVFIASFDRDGTLIGRGSGFFIDEGIVITNIHVINGAARYYKIISIGDDNSLDTNCYRDISLSSIKLNLEDDVAYLRTYIDCPHGSLYFADTDPEIGEDIEILGYPALGETFLDSFDLAYTKGVVTKKDVYETINNKDVGPWMKTDAKIYGGNSGGPVIQNGRVVGIAVASYVDKNGNTLDGLFIPVSMIRRGLKYANNSNFAYTPQEQQNNPAYESPSAPQYGKIGDPFNPIRNLEKATNALCKYILGHGGESTGYNEQQGDACRCKSSYHSNAAGTTCLPGSPEYVAQSQSSSSSSNSSSSFSSAKVIIESVGSEHKMYRRVCPRVLRRFRNNQKIWDRVNARISKRFGFVCSK